MSDQNSAAPPDDDEQLEGYTTAKARKDRFYRGKPCVDCGGTKRYVSSGNCVACAAAQERAYYGRDPEKQRRRAREYAERNQDKLKAYNEALRERIRACDKERPTGLIINRIDAIEAGYTTYYVKPCKHGHTCGRRHEGNCIDCQRAYFQARGGRTDARDAEAARARRAAKAAERAAKAAAKAERERVKAERAAERERARVAREAERRPRHESPRIASPRLTEAERDAIEQAARVRRVEEATARAERQRALAARRAEEIERARAAAERQVEEAKAAGKPHRRLAAQERRFANAQVAQARRATGERAQKGFSTDEAAALERALAAGKVTRIEQGEWDDREPLKRKW